MTREPVPATKRRPMTKARRARVLAAYNGCCAEPTCARNLTDGTPWIADHIIALDLGGPDVDDNLQPLCADPCNKIKTAHDHALIAKGRRLRGETCAGPKRKINGRGFEGWKNMRGEIVRRSA